MDIKSREERSRNMAKIKSTRTKPEMYIRTKLYHCGFRYRVNYAACYGKPDLFFSKYHIAVFVNGCFWHRHQGCRYAYTPKSNVEFWISKLESNRRHDAAVYEQLRQQHIRVLIIWECTVKKMMKDRTLEEKYMEKIIDFIKGSKEERLEL